MLTHWLPCKTALHSIPLSSKCWRPVLSHLHDSSMVAAGTLLVFQPATADSHTVAPLPCGADYSPPWLGSCYPGSSSPIEIQESHTFSPLLLGSDFQVLALLPHVIESLCSSNYIKYMISTRNGIVGTLSG